MSNDGKKFSISPGHPWNIVEAGHGLAASVFFYGRDNDESCRTREVVQARAALIEEALNVHAETGLTPTQLVDVAKKLRKAGRQLRVAFDPIAPGCCVDPCEDDDAHNCKACDKAAYKAGEAEIEFDVALEATKAVGE